MGTVATEQAQKEIESWLEYKKIGDKKLEAYKDNIETLVDSICEGNLVLNEDKSLTYKLKFPPEGEKSITELKFSARLKVADLHKSLKGVSANDADERLLSYGAALTGLPKGIFRALDMEDYSIVQAIVVFFV